jgi:hypothetical protein
MLANALLSMPFHTIGVQRVIVYKEKRDREQYTHYISKASIFTQATQAVDAWHGGQ